MIAWHFFTRNNQIKYFSLSLSLSLSLSQSQGITDIYAEYAEHRSTYILSLKNVGLWKDLSNEEIAYWIERGSSLVQHSCGPSSSFKRVYKKQSMFCTKALFYSTEVKSETYSREWLVYSPAKG